MSRTLEIEVGQTLLLGDLDWSLRRQLLRAAQRSVGALSHRTSGLGELLRCVGQRAVRSLPFVEVNRIPELDPRARILLTSVSRAWQYGEPFVPARLVAPVFWSDRLSSQEHTWLQQVTFWSLWKGSEWTEPSCCVEPSGMLQEPLPDLELVQDQHVWVVQCVAHSPETALLQLRYARDRSELLGVALGSLCVITLVVTEAFERAIRSEFPGVRIYAVSREEVAPGETLAALFSGFPHKEFGFYLC
ncbi:MAG: hypothetical protein KC925_01480 [Candidatus Doudnabacteria bacterium]|nr:hypothetical protein [Candidatus Doudnabacteria bacterium]